MNHHPSRSVAVSVVFAMCVVWLVASGPAFPSEPRGNATQQQPNIIFSYLPHAMPGSTAAPFAGEAFRGTSGNGPWGDSVVEIDCSTGQILDALKRLDLDEQTLVVWTNDNGAPAPDRRGGSNLPLKGNAYSVAEGGMRVPLIVRAAILVFLDFAPIHAELANSRSLLLRPDTRRVAWEWLPRFRDD